MPLRSLAALLLLFALAIAPAAWAGEVAVVLSDKDGVYGEFAGTFQQLSEGSGWQVRWVGTADGVDSAPRTDLIVAVGAEAARISLRRGGATPVVATRLPRRAYERALAEAGPGRARNSTTAVVLDQPPGRLLALARHLLPEHRRVGLLVGPESRGGVAQLRQAATANGLSLETEEVAGEDGLVPALNLLLPRADLLFAQPDGVIYRRDNIRAILLTSYRFQRPVLGFSQAMVTAGALAAIYSTPAQIARQTIDLLRHLSPEAVTLPAPQAPALFAIAVNRNVAQALGLVLPDEPALRRAMGADKDAK